jgi:hypothetical protein
MSSFLRSYDDEINLDLEGDDDELLVIAFEYCEGFANSQARLSLLRESGWVRAIPWCLKYSSAEIRCAEMSS